MIILKMISVLGKLVKGDLIQHGGIERCLEMVEFVSGSCIVYSFSEFQLNNTEWLLNMSASDHLDEFRLTDTLHYFFLLSFCFVSFLSNFSLASLFPTLLSPFYYFLITVLLNLLIPAVIFILFFFVILLFFFPSTCIFHYFSLSHSYLFLH